MHVCTNLSRWYFNVLVDATDEETYAGDTVFKQFFMDYVKKIGFYNGS